MTAPVPPRQFVATVGAPFVDESLLGYVGRALSVTAVRQIATMLRLADAAKPNAAAIPATLTDPAEIERVATLLGCQPADIASRTYAFGTIEHSGSEAMSFFGTEIRYHFRECKIRRVSPRALELEQYHRAVWELRPLAFDPQTKEKLLDTCPVCNRRLGWLRADVPTLCDKCDDTVDLRDFPQAVSAVEDEKAYDFVVGLVDPDPAKKEAARRLLPESWRGFSNGALFETAVALASGLTLDPSKSAKSAQGRSKGRDQFELLTPDLLALAGRAIIGGETGFAALCERYRSDMERRPQFYGRRKELGALAYITYDKHIDPTIRELLGGLVDANMQATSRDYALRKGADADRSLHSMQTLADMFKVRRKMMQRLAESGLVPVVRSKDVQSPVRMAVPDVLPLIVQMKDAIGETEAAGMLGLPLTVLPSLADRGLIRRLEGAVCGLVPGYRGYSKSSVDELMAKVWSAARTADGKGRSIVVAARSIGLGETPWAAVISAVITGDVEVFDTGTNRRNIRFSLAVEDTVAFVAGVRKHLQGAVGDAVLPEWIAQSTAAEILQINVAFLSRLANTRPDLLPSHGPGYTPYLACDVRTLASTYIFVPEIARRSEVHPRRAVSWLRSKNLHPSFALQNDRDFGYSRLAVEPLLAEFTTETAQLSAALDAAGDTIRTRFIKAVAAGAGPKATAEAMGVPCRQAKRWVEVWRETGAVVARKFGYRSKLDGNEAFLRQLVADQPTIKLAEIHDALGRRGVKTSKTSVWNALERFGIALADRDVRHAADVQKLLTDT
jgi:transposase